MKYYLFAKFMAHLTAEQLMEECVRLGVDGPTALIREGYWTEEGNLEKTLPDFVRRAEAHSLEVRYADTSFDPRHPEMWERLLPVLRDCGIRQFRWAISPRRALRIRAIWRIWGGGALKALPSWRRNMICRRSFSCTAISIRTMPRRPGRWCALWIPGTSA